MPQFVENLSNFARNTMHFNIATDIFHDATDYCC